VLTARQPRAGVPVDRAFQPVQERLDVREARRAAGERADHVAVDDLVEVAAERRLEKPELRAIDVVQARRRQPSDRGDVRQRRLGVADAPEEAQRGVEDLRFVEGARPASAACR
jgi:hypothetical protein